MDSENVQEQNAPTFSLFSQTQESEATTNTLETEATSKRHRQINCRCYPGKLIKVFEKLKEGNEEEKIEIMKSVGFYDLTKMQLTGLHTDFLIFVRDNFIPEKMKINLGRGNYLKLTEDDVHRVYKLPRGLQQISLSSATKEDIESLKSKLNIATKSHEVSVKEIYDKLSTYKDVETWFKAMMLCIIGYVLCPKGQLKVSLKYATILKNIKSISEFNWCRHILEHIKNSIKPAASTPGGDFHFITVHVMDTLYSQTKQEDGPTCRMWTKEKVHEKFDSISAYFSNAIRSKMSTTNKDSENTASTRVAREKTKKFATPQTPQRPRVQEDTTIPQEGHPITPEASPFSKPAPLMQNIGCININQMPKIEDCTGLGECKQIRLFAEYNFNAWKDYIEKINKRIYEIEQSTTSPISALPNWGRKRRVRFVEETGKRTKLDNVGPSEQPVPESSTQNAEENIQQNVSEKVDELISSLPILNPQTIQTTVAEEVPTIRLPEEMQKQPKKVPTTRLPQEVPITRLPEAKSKQEMQKQRVSEREKIKSVYIRTPYKTDDAKQAKNVAEIHITADEAKRMKQTAEINNKIVKYAFNAKLPMEEILYKDKNSTVEFNRETIRTMEHGKALDSAILDHYTRCKNIRQLSSEGHRLCFMTQTLSQMIYETQKDDFEDVRTDEECVSHFKDLMSIDTYKYINIDFFSKGTLQFIFLPVCYGEHYTVFAIDLKNSKFDYLNSINSCKLETFVAKAATFITRSIISHVQLVTKKKITWDGNWKEVSVPQQPKQSNACGWYVKTFMDEWKGEGVQMPTFRNFENKNEDEQKPIIAEERCNLCLLLIKNNENIKYRSLARKALN